MKKYVYSVIAAVLGLGGAGAVAYADAPAPPPHFQLIEPVSWIVESERGDPQKAGPCGGTNTDWGKETYVINEVKGGSKLHLKLREAVYHPGHYRVALAVNSPTELPPDPKVTTRPDSARGPMSVSAEIQNPAVAPVLVDGLFAHTERPAPNTFWETDIDIPNLTCTKCTLQVIQFMAEHANNNPGGYSYHHCAFLHITADT